MPGVSLLLALLSRTNLLSLVCASLLGPSLCQNRADHSSLESIKSEDFYSCLVPVSILGHYCVQREGYLNSLFHNRSSALDQNRLHRLILFECLVPI